MSILPYLIGICVVAMISATICIIYFASRYKKVPPDHAMIVYGQKSKGKAYDIITGGGRIIWPVVEDYAFLDLSSRNLKLVVEEGVIGKKDERIRVKATTSLNIGIGKDNKMLMVASENLLHKTHAEVNEIATTMVEGQMRKVMRDTPYKELKKNLTEVEKIIKRESLKDLRKVGIELFSFSITKISS